MRETSRSRRPFAVVALVVAVVAVLAAIVAAPAGAVPTLVTTQDADGGTVVAPGAESNAGTSGPALAGEVFIYVPPTWTWALNGPANKEDAVRDAAATGRRVVYVAGHVGESDHPALSLSKIADGVAVWTRSYAGRLKAPGAEAEAMAIRGKAVYTAGYRQRTANDTDLLLIRWNRSGKRVWTRVYDGGVSCRAYDVVVDREGYVTVVGVRTTAKGGHDWVVVSYTGGGKRRWVRRYDSPDHGWDEALLAYVDRRGRVYVAGTRSSWTNVAGQTAVLAKYSRAGRRLWRRRYDAPGTIRNIPTALAARPGGGVYIAGWTNPLSSGEEGLLLAYTAGGKRRFATLDVGPAPGASWSIHQFFDVVVLPGRDVLCGGSSYVSSPFTGTDRYTARVDPATGAITERTVVSSAGAQDEEVTALAVDAEGGLCETGTLGTSAGQKAIYTLYHAANGVSWASSWPAAPIAWDRPHAMAVYRSSVFVAGVQTRSLAWSSDQVVLAYVR